MTTKRKLIITGAGGFVGGNLVKYAQNNFADKFEVIPVTRKECDLEVYQDTYKFFSQFRNDIDTIVLHFAGYVGGIKENSENQYQMVLRNSRISCNVVESCKSNNIVQFISALSTCIYPFSSRKIGNKDGVVSEYEIELGFEESNYGYALAKSVLYTLTNECYKKGLDYKCVVPTNLFGPGDRWDEAGHLISRTIKKFDNAKRTNSVVEFWGNGTEKRQFLYIDDFCKIMFDLIDKKFDIVNVVDESCELETAEVIQIIQQFMDAKDVDYSFTGELPGIPIKRASEWKLEKILGDLQKYRNIFSYGIYKYLKAEGFLE